MNNTKNELMKAVDVIEKESTRLGAIIEVKTYQSKHKGKKWDEDIKKAKANKQRLDESIEYLKTRISTM